METINRRKFVSSAVWKMLEALSTKGISFFISIVLSWILLPEDYGVVGITDIFVSFSAILVQGGISTSLIRKKDVDDQDYSNAFFFCVAVASLCYSLFFIGAPFVATFYREPLVTSVLRIQMISLFLCALSTIRTAIIVRKFKFKQLCLINLCANILGGIAGILVALYNGGVWALVIYTLARDGISAFLLFFFVKWKLTFKISVAKLKLLVAFSIWVLISTLLDFFGNNIYSLLIGSYYTLADLGYFNKGYQLPQVVCLYVFGAITSVLLPALSQVQDDTPRLKNIVKKVTRMSAYTIFPMMMGLATVGSHLMPFLFSAKWNPSVPIQYAACLIFAVNPCRSINIQVLYAKGKSRNVMFIEMIRFTLLLLGLVVGVKVFNVDVYGLAYIQAAIAVTNTLVTHFFIRKIADYPFIEWIKDQLGPFVMSVAMGLAVIAVNLIPIQSHLVLLMIQVGIGVIVYVLLSKAIRSPELYDIQNMIGSKLRPRTK